VKIRHGKSHVQHYNDRTTPVNWAILGHNDRNVELLIRAGADLDHKEGLLGVTPLLDAANANMYQSVYLMLKAGADYRARDDAGLELAHYAVDDQPPLEGESRRWQDKVLAFLAQKGVDVEAARKAQAAKGIKTRGVVPGMGD